MTGRVLVGIPKEVSSSENQQKRTPKTSNLIFLGTRTDVRFELNPAESSLPGEDRP